MTNVSTRGNFEDQFVSCITRACGAYMLDPLFYILGTVLLSVGAFLSLGILAGPLFVAFSRMLRRKLQGELVTGFKPVGAPSQPSSKTGVIPA